MALVSRLVVSVQLPGQAFLHHLQPACRSKSTTSLPSSCLDRRFTPLSFFLAHLHNKNSRPGIASPTLKSKFTTTAQVYAMSMSAAAGSEGKVLIDPSKPFGVLFVCLGNICRSPTAEAVFTYLVEAKGLAANFKIDSAGTIDYHEGDPADGRMKKAALKHGVKLTSLSRPIRRSDFEDFDLILAMDRQNYADIMSAYQVWNNKKALPPGSQNKVRLMCGYCKTHELDEVPDPYYGGPEGFEKVLDLLEDACSGLLDTLDVRGASTA